MQAELGGPTLAQLKTAVKEHLAAHPEINTTVPQQLIDDAGYELIYTPPYVSDLQPIERVTAELCQKQIAHCHAWIEQFMQSEEGGSLQHFATLAALKPLAAALTNIDALALAPAAAPPAEEDEEEQQEAGWTQ